MEFKQYIQNKFCGLLDDYFDGKSKTSKFFNTLLQSYNIMMHNDKFKEILAFTMQKEVESGLDFLRTDEQKEKFIFDNTPINDTEYLENKFSQMLLLDTCSFIECALLECNFIITCIKNEHEFQVLGESAFEEKYKEESKNNFQNKYRAIKEMCIYTNIIEVFNKEKDLKYSINNIKYIFFIRNCIVHSGGIMQDYVIPLQNIIKEELEELFLPIFEKNKEIKIDISQVNTILMRLREPSELIIFSIFNKIEKYLDESSKCKINNYLDLNSI